MSSFESIREAVVSGEGDKLKSSVQSLLTEGESPFNIIAQGLMSGLSIVGQRWKAGDMFIPEVLMSAQVISEEMEILKPLVLKDKLSNLYIGKIIIGTVQGDLHNIGKNLVSLVLASGGFQVVDLGVDISAEQFVKAIEKEKPRIIGMSGLLTLTIPRMKDVIDTIKSNKLRDKVKIIVGGAPVTQEFADSIGADAYAPDAISALEKAKQLI